jgi:flagellar protein FlaG
MDAIGSVSAVAPIGNSDPGPGRGTPAAVGAPAMAQGAPAAPAAAPADTVTSEQLKAAVARANEQLGQTNRELAFVFDDKLGRMLVKIIDKQTNAVVRQVPSEDMLVMARALSDSPDRGVLIKSRA